MQAKLVAQSKLVTHSGRQLGGEPTNSSKQEHICPLEFPITLHMELGPHGDGRHGEAIGSCSPKNECINIKKIRVEVSPTFSTLQEWISSEV